MKRKEIVIKKSNVGEKWEGMKEQGKGRRKGEVGKDGRRKERKYGYCLSSN